MISCAAVTDVEACELCAGINDKEAGAVNSACQSNDMAESLEAAVSENNYKVDAHDHNWLAVNPIQRTVTPLGVNNCFVCSKSIPPIDEQMTRYPQKHKFNQSQLKQQQSKCYRGSD